MLKSIDNYKLIIYNKIKEREKREIIIDLESDKKLLLYIKAQKERRERL